MYNKENIPWQELDPTAALTARTSICRDSGEVSPGRFPLETLSFFGEKQQLFPKEG